MRTDVVTRGSVGCALRTGHHQLLPFARIDNLFLKYIGSVIVDQSSGGSFEPAPGRTFFVGVKVILRQE